MRRVLLAVLLLTGPIAGCVGPSEEGPVAHQPSWPTGLLLTYEVTENGTTAEETFLVRNETEGEVDMRAWNLSQPNFTSPFLDLNDRYNPRAYSWSKIFEWPIRAGDTHETRIGGADATMNWTEVEHEGPLDADTALEGVARTSEGEELARFRVSAGNVTALTYLELDAPDGTQQTWELTATDVRTGWNAPPAWTKGDWWTYEGSFQGETGSAQLVYTNDRSTQRSDQRVLSPTEVDDRVLMLPFLGWRDADIAPQSGFVSGQMSTFWSWPLSDGKVWGGTTSAVDGGSRYQAVAERNDRAILPDGTATVTFTVRAFVQDGEEPFAVFEYSPLVGHLVQWRMGEPGAPGSDLDFELEDWGQAFHGEMEIPQRALVEKVPRGNRTILTGPASIDRSFEVPERANRLQVAPRSFAVHEEGADPSFSMRLTDPNGTVAYERNASHFDGRRLGLSEVMDSHPGNWTLELEIDESVSMLARIFANWFETEMVDYR